MASVAFKSAVDAVRYDCKDFKCFAEADSNRLIPDDATRCSWPSWTSFDAPTQFGHLLLTFMLGLGASLGKVMDAAEVEHYGKMVSE